MAENRSPNDQHSLSIIDVPRHPRLGEPLLEVFDATFNDPGANRPAFFAEFEYFIRR